jgi:hypothetical protein
MYKATRQRLGLLLIPMVWAALCVAAPAQVTGQSNFGNFPGMLPGQAGGLMNSPANQIGLTPQMQQYMMLRALQGAGHHHGVHTGVANPIIGAGPQFDPSAAWTNYGSQQNSSGRHSSSEKRAAARLAREQQKQLARERAESIKAKAPTKVSKPKFNAS